MTKHPITVLEDGTRVYSNRTRYTPRTKRPWTRRKPPDEGCVMFGVTWYYPLSLLPADDREMPETRPDEDAYDHAWKPRKCKCQVCKRPQALKWRRKAFAQMRKDASAASLS